MIRKRRIGIGAVFVTLGIALAVAFILPAQLLVVVLALVSCLQRDNALQKLLLRRSLF